MIVRPCTLCPRTTSSSTEPNGSWPLRHIWKGAVALPNALAGQSTNGTNLNRKLAFTARSRGGSALAAALVGTVPARNMATAAARRIRRKARADQHGRGAWRERGCQYV